MKYQKNVLFIVMMMLTFCGISHANIKPIVPFTGRIQKLEVKVPQTNNDPIPSQTDNLLGNFYFNTRK